VANDAPEPEPDLWDRLTRETPSWPGVPVVPTQRPSSAAVPVGPADTPEAAPEGPAGGPGGAGDPATPTDPAGGAGDDPGGDDVGGRPSTGDVPVTGAPPTGAAGEPQAIEALRSWVARRTRTQVVALVLISLLALGPLVALVVLLRTDTGPVAELHAPEVVHPEVTRAVVAFTTLSPGQGELRARITVTPAPDLLDEDGRLLAPLWVSTGNATTELRAGETVRPFETVLTMSEGSVNRYPFDRYRGQLMLFVTAGTGEARELLRFQPEIRSIVGDFSLTAQLRTDPMVEDRSVAVVAWEAGRPPTTTVYAIWLMVLMWALAVTGLLIVWAVILWMVELPMWVFGYFVGVLFALPPLRDSLPGRPPPGTLFDFLSFYWSVTIIGVSLILSLSTWLTRTRAEHRLRAIDAGRHDTGRHDILP